MKGDVASQSQRIAVERADALFEQRRIGEIRAIENATQTQIQEKRTKLRELVGESYKDVIRSADAILEMSNHAGSIVSALHSIQATLKRPSEEPKATTVAPVADVELHIMGSRVKYVLDTQEVIWSALDVGDYVEATRRLLRAERVHDLLMHSAHGSVSKRFPFFEHLWPSVAQLKPQIAERIRQSVVGTVGMTESEVQLVLIAMVTLMEPSSMELLKTYLQYRKLSILNLSTNVALHTDPVQIFCQIGTLLQESVLHVMHLFLRGSGEMQLLRGIGQDAVGFRGFLFGALEGVSEQELWEQHLKHLQEGFEQISVAELVIVVEAWLQEVAEMVHASGEGLLLSCTHIKSLSKLEHAVKGALQRAEWQAEVQEQLGVELDLWKVVFESVLQEKCLSIVSAGFKNAATELLSQLESIKLQLFQSEMEALGQISVSAWTLHSQKLTSTSQPSFRSESQRFVTEFDQSLGKIMEEVSDVLGMFESDERDGEHSPHGSVRQGSVRSFSLLSGTMHRGILPRKTDRSVQLEPQIQSLWEETAFYLAEELETRITSLPQSRELQIVEVALFVGTVAMGLAENCPCMGLLAGPAEEWRPEAVPRSTRSSVKPEPSAPPHLSNAFRHVAFLGVHLWTDWALERLVGAWNEGLQTGKLTGDEHLQEITLSHQAAEIPGDQQMKFFIPSAPSEQTMQLLMEASLELQRLGFYSSHAQILHLFQFQLEKGIRDCVQTRVLMEATGKLSDNYVLQLLLDFRFLCDVCSAGAPVPKMEVEIPTMRLFLSAVPEDNISLHDSGQKSDPAVKRAILESQNLSKAVEGELSSLLDPIDWATYEPHLWTAEQRCYRRTQALFGSVGSTPQPLHSEVPVKLPVGSETNILQASAVTSRFQYLPVRPTTLAERGTQTASHINAMALTEQEDDPTECYSFSDLGQITASQGTSTLQEEMGSFTSLGTMFTDKAAEMSALAQQRFEQFGDYLQPSSLASSSLFSSFAKRVGPASGSHS